MKNRPMPACRAPRAAALLLVAGLGAGSAGAQHAGGMPDHRLWLQLGAFRPGVESSAQITDPAAGIAGTVIDFESQLGLPERKTLGQLLIGARFGERWRAEFEYFSLRRSASRAISATIVVDDTSFPAAGTVDTELDSKVYRAAVGYSFVKSPAFEAGAAIGLHVTDFHIALAGQGSIGGGPVTPLREQRDETVPLPTIGIYGSYAFAPRWSVAARADVFSLEARGYDGRLLTLRGSVIYRLSPNVGVGLGYRFDDYRLEAARSDFTGRFEYEFRGPQVFVEAGF